MKKHIVLAFISALSGLALSALNPGSYRVTVTLPPDDDLEGSLAYIVNYDTGENIDSVLVQENIAEFNGTVGEPTAARIIVDGNRMGSFILEEGEITINPAARIIEGGRLNVLNNSLQADINAYIEKLRAAKSEDEQMKIYDCLMAMTDSVMYANIDNPVGYLLFLDKAYDFEPADLEAFVANNPYFTRFKRVNKLLESNRRKMATGEGSMFTDFEIEYEGVKHRLSHVVGKGDYVLVDFWASWCGPCIAQTVVLKDIYGDYKDEGLKVLGVAVWDEPQNTLKAIEQHGLPWECWLNGGNIPTDAYGISGIPCIILFGPDGTIISRDKQSDELKTAVANAMAEAKANRSKSE